MLAGEDAPATIRHREDVEADAPASRIEHLFGDEACEMDVALGGQRCPERSHERGFAASRLSGAQQPGHSCLSCTRSGGQAAASWFVMQIVTNRLIALRLGAPTLLPRHMQYGEVGPSVIAAALRKPETTSASLCLDISMRYIHMRL